MKISQSLPKPESWLEFESLCKKLWGEIWCCSEIKKNGRSGQRQQGVDIYGIPKGEMGYFGIQCKGKDEYSGKNLTEQEICAEIDKAKDFQPELKKLYFATTANKDARIEEVVRKKNIEHIQKKLFEVHLYCWEDIVDLIFENKITYDYYLNSNSFKTNHSLKVTFKNGDTELNVNPKFIEKKHVAKSEYDEMEKMVSKLIPKFNFGVNEDLLRNYGMLDYHINPVKKSKKFNRSLIDSTIMILNDGSEPLEHWKLTLKLPKQILEVNHKNFEKIGHSVFLNFNTPSFESFINAEKNTIEIEPRNKILVGDDTYVSDSLYLKPSLENCSVKIGWKFVSKNYRETGELVLNIEPDITYKRIKVADDSTLLLNEKDRITIEDYFETINDE